MTVSQPGIQTAPSWDEFAIGLPRRFILPVHEFDYRISFVPIFLQPQERTAIVNLVREAVVNALKQEPECALSALQVRINPKQDIGSSLEREDEYFSITFGNPVFDFGIQLGPTIFRMFKPPTTLPNLLHTTRLFSRITASLFLQSMRKLQKRQTLIRQE